MFTSFDDLPLELLHFIAQESEPAYCALIRAYPRFARGITDGIRVDYRIGFGHSVKSQDKELIWTRHNVKHRLEGPAVESADLICYHVNGVFHRSPRAKYLPAYILWYPSKIPGEFALLTMYSVNGGFHRLDGPAIEDLIVPHIIGSPENYHSSECIYNEYFIYGEYVDQNWFSLFTMSND